ncbi:MAG TPA: GNAT family N-acetyltransferase [Candidatus Nitrosotenuis sp.]|jgi:hypothetical protein|nr:GNAT family N-acetyltransferase [Candidatus Nitrosotenuis sp.]
MQILPLTGQTKSQFQDQLAAFEQQFTYPLGENTFFTIDHGDDYSAFFENLGQAKTWIALEHGQIIGCVSLAIRDLYAHNRLWRVGYLGDLKIDPDHQRGRTLYLLARAVQESLIKNVDFGYGVVMGGTSVTPPQYTGRLGIPRFVKGGDRLILKFSAFSLPVPEIHEPEILHSSTARELFLRLSPEQGWWERNPFLLISSRAPEWIHMANQAIGCYEDTLYGKRLFLTTGQELTFGHLTNMAFSAPMAARQVILYALRRAQKYRMNGLFSALTRQQYHDLKPFIADLPHDVSISDVYLTHPEYNSLLTINTADI